MNRGEPVNWLTLTKSNRTRNRFSLLNRPESYYRTEFVRFLHSTPLKQNFALKFSCTQEKPQIATTISGSHLTNLPPTQLNLDSLPHQYHIMADNLSHVLTPGLRIHSCRIIGNRSVDLTLLWTSWPVLPPCESAIPYDMPGLSTVVAY